MTTTSLREELIKYLDFLEHYDYNDEEIEKRANDILKIFEERIDSMESKYNDMEVSMCADMIREELLK